MIAVVAVIMLIGGLLFSVLLGMWPKIGCGVLVAATLIAQTLQTVFNSSLAGNVDELAVVAAFVIFSARRILVRGTLRFVGAYWFFAAYAVFGMISAVLNNVPLGTWILSGFLFLKGPLLMLGVLQIDWRRDDIPKIIRFGTAGLLMILLSAVANAMAPEAWNAVVGRQAVSYRLGIPSLTGIFDHPVGLGSIMGMAFLAVLSYRRIIERSILSLTLLLASGAVGLLTFRRKSIASVVIVAIGSRMAQPGMRTRFTIALAAFVPIALVIGWEPFMDVVTNAYKEYFSNVNTTARTIMTIDSVTLAAAAFPFGVGFGRFGSAVASSNYSPLYDELGYTRIHGMGPGENGGYLTDTFWPAILAESGFIGLLCYLIGLLLLIRPAWRLMRNSGQPHVQWLGAVVVAWMGQLLIESIVAPVFTGPPMFGPVFMLAGIATAVYLRESSMGHSCVGRTVPHAGMSGSDTERSGSTSYGTVHGRRRYQEM